MAENAQKTQGNGSSGSSNTSGASNSSSSFDVLGMGIDLGFKALDLGASLSVEKLEVGLCKIEKIKIIEKVKRDYHVYVSKKISNRASSALTPSIGASSRASNLSGKSGQAWLDGAKDLYEQKRQGRLYKMQHKGLDMARDFVKKPLELVKIPIGLLPLGELGSKGVDLLFSITGKLTSARRERKKGKYADSGNRQILEAKLGKQEYARKVAKWQAKDIAELGPKIQHNLYKLKQATQVLNTRQAQLNLCVAVYLDSKTSESNRALARAREQTSMSLYEVQHYAQKITEMCVVMEATAFSTKAYMLGLEAITDDCEKDILNTFS